MIFTLFRSAAARWNQFIKVYFSTYGYALLFCWKFRDYSRQFIREVVCTIHRMNDYPRHLVLLASVNLIVIFCSKGGQRCPPFEQPRPLSCIAFGKCQAVDKLHVNRVLSGWRPCLLDTFSLPNLHANEIRQTKMYFTLSSPPPKTEQNVDSFYSLFFMLC